MTVFGIHYKRTVYFEVISIDKFSENLNPQVTLERNVLYLKVNFAKTLNYLKYFSKFIKDEPQIFRHLGYLETVPNQSILLV